MHSVIQVDNLSKQYPKADFKSLNEFTLSIEKGSKTGIFGPNGAGKTTLISIMCGVIESSSGNVSYLKDNKEIALKEMLYKIGYVPQDFSFYPEISAWENLMYFGSLYDIKKKELAERSESLLKALGLIEFKNKKVGTFSGGMKRRVNLAIGIINKPEILFLDEPTVGVDVQSKNAIIEYLDVLNQNGTTIIYTSHHMNEGQSFCNQIVLMDKGELITNEPTSSILKSHNTNSLEEIFLKLTGKAYRD